MLQASAPEQRPDAIGLYKSRNIGSSVGISVVFDPLVRNNQINHADIASHVTAVNHAFSNSTVRHAWNPLTASRRAALDQVTNIQASIISYIDDFQIDDDPFARRDLSGVPASPCRNTDRERSHGGDGMNDLTPP